MNRFTILLLLFISGLAVFAQNVEQVSMEVTPVNESYLYKISEVAKMNIVVNSQTDVDKCDVTYKLSLNGVEILSEGKVRLIKGKGTVSGTLAEPGFLRCDVTCVIGKDTLHAVGGCGFNVEEIKPKGKLPKNFKWFWDEAKIDLTRIPIDAQLEEIAVLDPGDARKYKVSLANVNGTRVWGWLHLPKGNGPFPTVLSIPGSGVGRTGRFAGFTEAGMAVLAIEIHGLKPGNKEIVGGVQFVTPADDVIRNFVGLQNGILNDYHRVGKEDPYRYIHRSSLSYARY